MRSRSRSKPLAPWLTGVILNNLMRSDNLARRYNLRMITLSKIKRWRRSPANVSWSVLGTLIFVLLLIAATVNGQQSSDIGQHTSAGTALSDQTECIYLRDALQAAEQRVEYDQGIIRTNASPARNSSIEDPKIPVVDLQYDRETLEHAKAELAKCLTWNERAVAKRAPTKDCASSEFTEIRVSHKGQAIHDVQLWRQREGSAFFFESSLYVDADGAPNAYNWENRGLDDLANAGAPGSWEGLADWQGIPYIQGPDDPFPGYYVSTTALTDQTKASSDPARYVDASRIPYIVLCLSARLFIASPKKLGCV